MLKEPGVGGSRSESGYPALESEAFTAPGGLGRSTNVEYIYTFTMPDWMSRR